MHYFLMVIIHFIPRIVTMYAYLQQEHFPDEFITLSILEVWINLLTPHSIVPGKEDVHNKR